MANEYDGTDRKDDDGASFVPKLVLEVERSAKMLKVFRDHRWDAVRSYIGSYYSNKNKNSAQIVPIGLLNLFVDIYTAKLSGANPRAFVTTRKKEFRPDANTLGLAVDKDVERMQFGRTVQKVVKDGLFSFGVVCTYAASEGEVEINEKVYETGNVVSERIDLDDFVCDMDAREFGDCYFIGHKIRVPLKWAKDNERFDATARKELRATDSFVSQPTTMGGGEKVEALSKDDTAKERDRFIPQTEIWILYLRETNEILMMAGEDAKSALLRYKWRGPKCPTGPYRFLGYRDVPGNMIPLPPVAVLRELSEVANDLLFKLTEQARNQKTILAYHRRAHKDAERIQTARDQELVGIDFPIEGNIGEFKSGGIDPQTMATFLATRDLFERQAGNLGSLGGLEPQSETATQDKLIALSANAQLKPMIERTEEFVGDVLSDIAWHRWNDPLNEVHVTKRVQGTDIEIPAVFSMENRRGDLEDYDLKVVPYSMQRLSPAETAGIVKQMWVEEILPGSQMSGDMPDVQAYIRLMAKLRGVEAQIDELVKVGGEPQTLPTQQGPGKPAVTQRNYTRTNRPTSTTQGKDRVLQEIAMGGNPQPKERAGLARPVGG